MRSQTFSGVIPGSSQKHPFCLDLDTSFRLVASVYIVTVLRNDHCDACVFRNIPCYLLIRNIASPKQSVFVDNFVKTKADAKSFVWNFFENLVNKGAGTVKDFNSVYCNKCSENSEIKMYKEIVSTTN